MPGTERLYLLKTTDGQEYGPVDQDCLVKWAENGRITPQCQIRSTLIARWERASDVPFLTEILLRQVAEQAPAKVSFWERVKQRVTLKAPELVESSGLHTVRPEDYERAPVSMRLGAVVVDAITVLIFAVLVYLAFAALVSARKLDAEDAFYLGVVLFWGLFLFGAAWVLAVVGQTAGQKFWGLILIRSNGEPFYLCRAYLYILFTLMFGVLTPVVAFISPSHRSLQEILTGTRMVKVKLVSRRR